MANFNTGATASANNAASCAITIPSGVLTNDVMVLNIALFTENTTAPTISFSGAGGTWSLVPLTSGTNPTVSQNGTIYSYQYAYYRVATAGDPGGTLTITETGSAAATTWWGVQLAAYTGFYTASPIDIAASSQVTGNTGATIVTPSLSTQRASSWPVYTMGGGLNSGTTVSYSGTATQREYNDSSAGVGGGIWDFGSGVALNTGIGGGTFTVSTGNNYLGAFTIALATQAIPSVIPTAVPPRIPHPLWFQLLEVAEARADWQAQGTASVVQQHWRLMDGVNGRPGVGSTGTQPPASGTSNASALTNGLSFYVTQSGMWFEGFWYWVAASGQATAPQQFALWTTIASSSTGMVVPGTAVTSGTLTAGQWNYVPLPAPVPLALYGVYVAAVGIPASAGYPDTAGQFGAGQPYAGGIANGPLAAFSDLGAGNPAPGNFGQSGTNGTGSNPSVAMPGTAFATHDNTWLDVQVTNVPPPGYGGPFRLWPDMLDADFNSSADAAANYVVGTKVIFSETVVVTDILYYVPGGMGSSGNQWATSADIWRVRDQVRVATQPNPVWVNPFTGGVDGQSNSGRWVSAQLPGPVTLPAGEYAITVYNSNASPNGWSAKRLGYWQPYNQSPDGTYQHAAPGATGITSGPMTASTTPAASSSTDYLQPTVTEPGQSVFATGPPNQFPGLYVGTPTPLFQNYWVDARVYRAAAYQPDAPDIPQRIPHPLFYELLEAAAYRQQRNTTTATAPVAVQGAVLRTVAARRGAPPRLARAGFARPPAVTTVATVPVVPQFTDAAQADRARQRQRPGFSQAPVLRVPAPQFTTAVRTAPRPQPRRQAFAPPPVVKVALPPWTRAARAPDPCVPRQFPPAAGLPPRIIAFPVLARRGPPPRAARAGFARTVTVPVTPPPVPPVFPVLTARRRPAVAHPRAQVAGPLTPGAARPAPPAWLGQWTRAVRRHRTTVPPAEGFFVTPRAVTLAAAPVTAFFTRALRAVPRLVSRRPLAPAPNVAVIAPQRVTAARLEPRLPRQQGFSPQPRIQVIVPQPVQARRLVPRQAQAAGFLRAQPPATAPVIAVAWTRALRALRAIMRRPQVSGPATPGASPPPPPPWLGQRTSAVRKVHAPVPPAQGFERSLLTATAPILVDEELLGGTVIPLLPYSGTVTSQAGYGGMPVPASQYGGTIT